MFSKYLNIVSKVKRNIGELLGSFSQMSHVSFQSGQFYFLWCIYWFIARMSIRSYLVAYIGYTLEPLSFEVLHLHVLHSFGITVILIFLALIPTLLTSRSQIIHEWVRTLHQYLLFVSEVWSGLMLSIMQIWSLILYSRGRVILFIIFGSSLFLLTFFFPMVLCVWFPFVYLMSYFFRVWCVIFPNITPIKDLNSFSVTENLLIERICLYSGIPLVAKFYARKKKTNKPQRREFHSNRIINGGVDEILAAILGRPVSISGGYDIMGRPRVLDNTVRLKFDSRGLPLANQKPGLLQDLQNKVTGGIANRTRGSYIPTTVNYCRTYPYGVIALLIGGVVVTVGINEILAPASANVVRPALGDLSERINNTKTMIEWDKWHQENFGTTPTPDEVRKEELRKLQKSIETIIEVQREQQASINELLSKGIKSTPAQDAATDKIEKLGWGYKDWLMGRKK